MRKIARVLADPVGYVTDYWDPNGAGVWFVRDPLNTGTPLTVHIGFPPEPTKPFPYGMIVEPDR